MGNLQEASLAQLSDRWIDRHYPAFLKLCQQVYDRVTASASLPIIDWHAAIARRTEASLYSLQ